MAADLATPDESLLAFPPTLLFSVLGFGCSMPMRRIRR
jgi:hypothetical protein